MTEYNQKTIGEGVVLLDKIVSLSPNGETASIRIDKLPQGAIDLLAWAFENVTASNVLPLPMNAAEVRIEEAIKNILHGGTDAFCRHGGSDSLSYFHHVDDEEWAIIFSHDCPGNVKSGQKLLDNYKG